MKHLRISTIATILVSSFFFITLVFNEAYALGNHPEANTCPNDKPYYVFCSHGLHNLEGWIGGCFQTREAAQQAANDHYTKRHKGNSRWTGVLKIRAK